MSGARTIEDSARLSIAEQSGVVVMTLVEGLARDELLRSRQTRCFGCAYIANARARCSR